MYTKMTTNMERLKFAAGLAVFSLTIQLIAYIVPYLEYFGVVSFGLWFLGFSLLLNLTSVFGLLFFFVRFYQTFFESEEDF